MGSKARGDDDDCDDVGSDTSSPALLDHVRLSGCDVVWPVVIVSVSEEREKYNCFPGLLECRLEAREFSGNSSRLFALILWFGACWFSWLLFIC